MPMTTRPAMRMSVVGATAAITEPAQNTATPNRITFLRPSRSPMVPKLSIKAGKGQGVAVDHPLQLADRGVQVALHVGQHHRHDGVVEEGQEEDEQQGRQGQRPRSGSRHDPQVEQAG